MLGVAPHPVFPATIAYPFALPAALVRLTLAQVTPAPTAPTAVQSVLPPMVILIMCVVGGIATVLLLPSRREHPVRKMGGAILLAAALILTALLVRYAAQHGGGLGVYFWTFAVIALGGAVRVVTHPRPVYSALYFVLTVFATAGLFILLWAEFMAAALVLIYAGAILVTYVFVIMLAASAGAPVTPRDQFVELDDEAYAEGDGNGSPALSGTGADAGDSAVNVVAEHDAVSRDPLVAAAVGFALMGVLLFVIFDRAQGMPSPSDRAGIGGAVREEPMVAGTAGLVQKLGVYLFQNQGVNLELAGLLLTVSMIGAIIIARRRIHLPEREMAASGPMTGGRLGAPAAAGAMSAIDDDPHAIPVYGTDNPRQKAYPET